MINFSGLNLKIKFSCTHFRKIIYLEDSSQAVVDVLDTSSDLSSSTCLFLSCLFLSDFFLTVRTVGFWVQSVDAVVLMYSVSDRASFNAMEDWRRRILQNRENLPIILVIDFTLCPTCFRRLEYLLTHVHFHFSLQTKKTCATSDVCQPRREKN